MRERDHKRGKGRREASFQGQEQWEERRERQGESGEGREGERRRRQEVGRALLMGTQ